MEVNLKDKQVSLFFPSPSPILSVSENHDFQVNYGIFTTVIPNMTYKN